MILSYSQFFLGLVLVTFIWIIVDWFFGLLRERGEERYAARRRRECHLCGKIYAEEKKVKISQCPDCSAQNTRGRNRRLG